MSASASLSSPRGHPGSLRPALTDQSGATVLPTGMERTGRNASTRAANWIAESRATGRYNPDAKAGGKERHLSDGLNLAS